jgi:hypothetical protein
VHEREDLSALPADAFTTGVHAAAGALANGVLEADVGLYNAIYQAPDAIATHTYKGTDPTLSSDNFRPFTTGRGANCSFFWL